MSTYASHVRLNKGFWEALDETVKGVLNNEKLFIGWDFNGHIRSLSRGYDDVHEGFVFDERNEEKSCFCILLGLLG